MYVTHTVVSQGLSGDQIDSHRFQHHSACDKAVLVLPSGGPEIKSGNYAQEKPQSERKLPA